MRQKMTRGSSSNSLSSLLRPGSKTSSKVKVDEFEQLVKIKRRLKETPLAGSSITNAMVYRFAYFYSLDEDATVEAILRDYGKPQLHLKLTEQLLAQFQTTTLFPLPDLFTKERNCRVFYMRPSRFLPAPDGSNTNLLIDNLCYVLNDMSQTKAECRKGVGFICNMEGWTADKNYTEEYYFQFMQALQGSVVPTKVRLFLIVNPPSEFSNVWKNIKATMRSKRFARNVHVIKEQRLGEFLKEGYHEYLPDEFACGSRSSNEICEDFIDLKLYEEQQELHKSTLSFG